MSLSWKRERPPRRRSSRRLGRFESLETRELLAAEPVISEFLALNTNGLVDEDGQASDWLELANWGDTPISLSGWYLTDDLAELTQWPLPDLTLAAGEQRLIFASGKDRRSPQGPLHTNFRLSGDGEALALVKSDGTSIAFAYQPTFPPQVADVSYGVFQPDRSEGFFSIPTPGAANPSAPTHLPPQAVVISEIMYHPASEEDADEFIELLNVGSEPVDFSGWRISGGIDLLLPGITLQPGQAVAIAADVAAFQASYGAELPVIGPWTGRLGNQSETITLRNEADQVVDRVTYADEGDWARRGRGPDDRGHFGWVWLDEHDGGGKSLELVNPAMPNDFGQNWAASLVSGGTPGATNSIAAANLAPLILDVIQQPDHPAPVEAVTVEARVYDELRQGTIVNLFWRLDGASEFTSTSMLDTGLTADRLAGDGVYTATIAAQPDGTVVEYYVEATDPSDLARTWPAATADAGQATNALYQVMDTFDPAAVWVPGSPPVYYQIMTAAEREEFTGIDRLSDAQMNATFISVTSQGIQQRHNAGIRIRGSGSRTANPPNNRINLPSDRPWQGVTALNLNVVAVGNQVAGSALFRLAGLPAAEATGAVMYSNGVNLMGDQLYAHVEPLNSDFADNHFPLDSGGNLYKGRRPNESPPGGQGAGLAYFGPDPAPYVSYTKLTNESQADWSDVIRLTDVLNNSPDDEYLDQVAQVADIDQWLRFFALNVLVSNTEGGLVNGDRQGDDYAMYRGIEDPRFVMVPHDLDSILSQVTRGLFTAINVPALNRMLLHPELKPRYYDQLRDLVDNVFLAEDTQAFLREALEDVASERQIESILSFLERRAEFVRAAIPVGIEYRTGLPQVNGRVNTTESALGLYGTADYRASSLRINGRLASFAQSSNTWQIGSFNADLVSYGANWQYLDNGSDQGSAWKELEFVPDASWNSGPAELGYGDGDEATVIGAGDDENQKFVTTYFRHEFELPDAARYHSLVLQLIRDDGAVVYLNGQRVATSNMPTGVEINYQTLAASNVNGAAERAASTYTLDPALLRDGNNVLAVEVHQVTRDNPDVSFNARLFGRFNPPNSGVPLTPGVNHLVIQAFRGADGTGEVVATEMVDVWYDDGSQQIMNGSLPAGQTTWSSAAGPYQISGQVTVPVGATLVIEPGTSVLFEPDAELVVRGTLIARGNAQGRIRFTALPGVPDVPDLPGLPDGPARWKGIHFVESRSPDNLIAYADIEYAQDSNGAIGVIDSDAVLEQLTFKGTHLRMVYGSNASLVVRNSDFPDMFAADENPAELKLDNISEHIKIVGRTPAGGQLIIQGNRFGTNKGHNDVIDADSNRVSQGPILQVLDNEFSGAGDELLDLGGDVYVAGNLFRGVSKDDSTSDRGYANAISTGDAGANTTIVVARNVFYDVDHAINLKNRAATIFEHNTVVKVHPDFVDRFENPNVGSAINLYVDEPGATPGAGAYAAGNIFWDAPRIFGNADLPGDHSSALQLFNNVISPELAQSRIGQRPGTVLDLGTGNVIEDPRLVDPAGLDFRTAPGSAALSPQWPAPWGSTAPSTIWVSDEPATPTTSRQASLMVGGPGLFAFRYRVNGGPWSDERPIGNGFDPTGTVRTARIELADLADGAYSVEVIGKDFAGNWQATPTQSASWTVQGNSSRILISEVLANNQETLDYFGARPDAIELHNAGSSSLNLRGWQISDDPNRPDKFVFAQDVLLPAGGYLVLYADDRSTPGTHLDFSLSSEGEGVYLRSPGGDLVDSVEFGMQVADRSIARVGPARMAIGRTDAGPGQPRRTPR